MIVNGRPINGLFVYDSGATFTKGDLLLNSDDFIYVVHKDYCGALNGAPESAYEYCTEYNQYHYENNDSDSALVLGSTLAKLINLRFEGLSGGGFISTLRNVDFDQLNQIVNTGVHDVHFIGTARELFGEHLIVRTYKTPGNKVYQELLDFENGIIWYRIKNEDDTWTDKIIPSNQEAYQLFKTRVAAVLNGIEQYVREREYTEGLLRKFNFAEYRDFERTDFLDASTCASHVIQLPRFYNTVLHVIISRLLSGTGTEQDPYKVEQFPVSYYLNENTHQDNIVQLDNLDRDRCIISMRENIRIEFLITSTDKWRVEYIYIANGKEDNSSSPVYRPVQ